jgi:hypothetical protein
MAATNMEMAAILRRAAEGTITQLEFYKHFRPWKIETKSPLSELIFEEIEHFWANKGSKYFLFINTAAPENILANDQERMRIVAKALEQGWAPERAEKEVHQWRNQTDGTLSITAGEAPPKAVDRKLSTYRHLGCLAISCWECYFYTFRSSLRPGTAGSHTVV